MAHRVTQKLQPRMILADEVGLGKTIEAGLIIKELRARELIGRVLIIVPASLQLQWQSELRSKFNEEFEILDGAALQYVPVAMPEPLRSPAVQAARKRRRFRRGPPAPSLLDPRRDRGGVGPGLAAQHRGLAGERLIRLSLARALEDPGHLGEQVSASGGKLPEFGHCGGFLVGGQVPPLRPPARLAVDLGDEEPVSLRALIDHAF